MYKILLSALVLQLQSTDNIVVLVQFTFASKNCGKQIDRCKAQPSHGKGFHGKTGKTDRGCIAKVPRAKAMRL